MSLLLAAVCAAAATCLVGYAARRRHRRSGPMVAGVLLGAAALVLTVMHVTTSERPVASNWQEAWEDGSTSVLQEWFAASTGPTVPLTTTTTGLYTVDSQDAADALVGRTVHGRVVISAHDVTVRDFKAVGDGTGSSVVEVVGGLTGVVLQDFEIDGRDHLTTIAGLGGGTWARVTVRRADVHHSLDGIRLFEGSTYEHVYVHDSTAHPQPYDDADRYHADAVQVVRAGQPIVVRRSYLDHSVNGPNTTSVVMCKSDSAPVDDVTIEQSYLNGGEYTVTVEASAGGAPTDIAVRDNRFGRDYVEGLWSGAGVDEGEAYDRTGNVWADTLEPVPLQWGRLRG